MLDVGSNSAITGAGETFELIVVSALAGGDAGLAVCFMPGPTAGRCTIMLVSALHNVAAMVRLINVQGHASAAG